MGLYVPDHIAIIMDGNGRWGKTRGLTRSEGHYAGVKAMERVIDTGIELGVKVLTLYAFSSENWSRPQDEVNYLMQLPVKYFKQKLPEFKRRNCQIRISGNIAVLPKGTKKALDQAVTETSHNTGIIINFAFNYGGRADIVQAACGIWEEVKNNKLSLDDIDEDTVHTFLYTGDLPDPDLIIRTGGEKRVSNFLLWQSSMSELYFSDVYFPDFTSEMFQAIIEHCFNKRMAEEI